MKEYKEIGSFKSMEMTFTIEDADLDKLHDVLKDINVRECPWFEVQDKHGNKARYYREPHWIPCSERLPENNVPVNITWVNRNPESYYADIKDQPFTATGVHYNNKWYWYSDTIEDILAEYGKAEWYEIEESIEVTAWMPLPDPYGGEQE